MLFSNKIHFWVNIIFYIINYISFELYNKIDSLTIEYWGFNVKTDNIFENMFLILGNSLYYTESFFPTAFIHKNISSLLPHSNR